MAAPINYEAWAKSAVGFIREKGLEVEFRDWCGGWPAPFATDASPCLPPPPLQAEGEG